MNVLEQLEKEHVRLDLPAFRPGDTVKVHVRIVEGGRERIQVFEGVVIGINRKGSRSSFTVRKVRYGIGVERVLPAPFTDVGQDRRCQPRSCASLEALLYKEAQGQGARIKEKVYKGQNA